MTQLHNKRRVLDRRQEVFWTEQTALGVAPPQQGLKAVCPPGHEVDDGLVMDLELVTVKARDDVVGESRPLLRVRVHWLVKEGDRTWLGALGPVHRSVGVAKHLFRSEVRNLARRDADARARDHLVTVKGVDPRQSILDAHGREQSVVCRRVGQQDNKLIAAKTGGRILCAQLRCDRLAHPLQHKVAHVVT